MSVQVVVLRGAESDLHELRIYVSRRFGARAWANTLQGVRDVFTRIAAHPESGRLPDELAPLNLVQFRQVLAGMNRVVYELRGPVAYVHLVCDARRDLKAVLLRRLVEAPCGK